MVSQALRMKIAYWSKEKKEEKENTRDRSVPDGSDKNTTKQQISPDFITNSLILQDKF